MADELDFVCEKCVHYEVCDRSSRMIWAKLSKEKVCSDFMEVVRCKDCEHKYLNKHGETCCEIWAHNRDTVVIDYDFCSYGRRKINV